MKAKNYLFRILLLLEREVWEGVLINAQSVFCCCCVYENTNTHVVVVVI
jgi:hypothetical protein